MVAMTTYVIFVCGLFFRLLNGAPVVDNSISLPLVDNLKAVLTANLDVSQFNTQISDFIQKEVDKRIQSSLKDTIDQSVQASLFQITNSSFQDYTAYVRQALSDLQAVFDNAATEQTRLANVVSQQQNGMDNIKNTMQALENRFTKENKKYAFYATLTEDLVDAADKSVIKFDNVKLNKGACYDGTSGKFTAPEDGLYLFTWTTLSDPEKDFSSTLFVNGNQIAENVVDADKVKDHMSGTMTVVVEMSKNQKAWLEVSSNEGKFLESVWNAEVPCSVFSGYKI